LFLKNGTLNGTLNGSRPSVVYYVKIVVNRIRVNWWVFNRWLNWDIPVFKTLFSSA